MVKSLLLSELGPELGESEGFLEEDVPLHSGLGALIELTQDVKVALEVVEWLHLKETLV